ncbi:hypothetical protein PIB30_044188 [Stylosanthes scabra]|uniref:Uncharacterized protein n=1 Tax=Stylosanthes scabra TaxID=79078 RepID=A0ABU6ZEJ9_9FABA|nr:hypothetical protein [Stylosanthes scabra]
MLTPLNVGPSMPTPDVIVPYIREGTPTVVRVILCDFNGLDLSEIIMIPCCGVTCLFKFERKNDRDSVDTDSTISNAVDNILSLSSCTSAISNC